MTPSPRRCRGRATEGSFWEISTAAHIDWPQQSRLLELVADGDENMVLVSTVVDHAGPPRTDTDLDGAGIEELASVGRELAHADPQASLAAGGDPEDRNVIIDLHRPAPDPVIPPHPFGDVPAWADPSVDWASWHGYLSGSGSFRPRAPMRRGEAARFLFRVHGRPAAAAHGFEDVPGSLGPAVSWVSDDTDHPPFMTGFGPRFRPTASLSRAEAARVLHRLAGSPDVSGVEQRFDDVPPWADAAVRWLTNTGEPPYATGFGDGFRPRRPVSRAELVRMVFRINR